MLTFIHSPPTINFEHINIVDLYLQMKSLFYSLISHISLFF